MKNYYSDNTSYSVTLCEDGVYRWRYDVNLIKNPTFFLLVWKILVFVFLCIFAVITVHDAVSFDNFYPDRFLNNLKFMGYIIIGITVVSILGYLLYAAIMGFKYCVIFEMDESGINHRQIPSQAKKAKKIAKATVFAGAASGSFSTMGAGMGAARTEMYSDFSKVRKIKVIRRRNTIKLNAPFSHNQVYASKEDFDFVEEYITSRCNKS